MGSYPKPREALENGTTLLNVLTVEKSNGVKTEFNKTKAGKSMDDFTGLSDKTVQRLREYLLDKGWTADQILDLLDYITK